MSGGSIRWSSTLTRIRSAASMAASLADHALGSQGVELLVGETHILAQHLAGVLAEPWDPRLGSPRHLAEPDRVARSQDRLVDAVRAGHLHQHVAGSDVPVVDDFFVGEARAGGDARGRQR